MAVRLGLAITVGAATGAVTEWSVLHVPFSLEPLTNTAAPWVLVSFAVALTARWMGESLLLAVTTLVAEVLGFYIVEALRGWSVSGHQVVFWSVTSLVVGPLVGLAAGWLRHAGSMAAGVAAGAIGGVLAGEAVYGLTGLKFSSPADYWRVQFVLGIGLTLALTLWRCRGRLLASGPAVAASLASCAIVGAGTLVAYRVP
jgi:hypothetical protein